MQVVKRESDLPRLVGSRRIDKDPARLCRDFLEQCWVVVRYHDVAILIPLLRDDAVLDHWNRRTLLRSESDANHGESHLPRTLRFAEHFVGIVESLAVTHQDDRLITLGLVEREKICRLA